jgi:hypothetical protein
MDLTLQSNNRIKEKLRGLLQTPPPGLIQIENLSWKSIDNKAGPEGNKQAIIYFDRRQDFIDAQSSKGNCNFTKGKSRVQSKKVLPQPKINSCLESRIFECEYGPEDFSDGKEGGHQGTFPRVQYTPLYL